jgi:uncharacterized protein YbjT (DUF2867 family)
MKVIITGATGMVGEGVLHECALSEKVSSVLVVGRKPCGYEHSKVKEIIVPDFMNLSGQEEILSGYDACFFCSGVSAVGKSEEEYTKLTYDLTLYFANYLLKLNQGMVFSYVSGQGTDSTEKGFSMWARVKGKTENKLSKLGFKKVYNFRPGYMHPTPGLKNTLSWYTYIKIFYPLIKIITPNSVSTLGELGQAMINSVVQNYPNNTIEVADILKLAQS